MKNKLEIREKGYSNIKRRRFEEKRKISEKKKLKKFDWMMRYFANEVQPDF